MPTEADHTQGVRAPGRYNATVGSELEARRIVRGAMPDAVEVPRAIAGRPYPVAGPGVLKWYQVQPAEPQVGNDLPHVKYEDWTGGKKKSGRRWGHIFFPEPESSRSGGLKRGRIPMSFMLEVYYKAPVDLEREEEITGVVVGLGGSLDCRGMPDGAGTDAVCLTFEFPELESARVAAASLRRRGDHVEGPVSYGP